MPVRCIRNAGFTLVELLVALFITAIIFAMGYGAINQALNDRSALQEQQERLTSVQRTMRTLTQDFSQLVARPVRDTDGINWRPALIARPGSELIVEFTRGGWTNPAGIQRASQQRVAYRLEEGTLKRIHWPVLDAAALDQTIERDMLTGVRSFSIRYMDDGRQWREQWPIAFVPGNAQNNLSPADRAKPLAVEVTIELEDWGRLVRIIEVPT